jgi:hypothetical protein
MWLVFIDRCLHLLLEVRFFLGGDMSLSGPGVNIATADGGEKFASKV